MMMHMIYDHFDAQGLAMGVVVGGFGGGAFIFNQIQVQVATKLSLYSIDVFLFRLPS